MDFDVKGHFYFTIGSIIMGYWLICWPEVTVWIKKCLDGFVFLQMCSFLLHNTLIDGLESCGLFVDYRDAFITTYENSDGTHSLQRIHWWESDVILNFSKSYNLGKVLFLVNYSFLNSQQPTISWPLFHFTKRSSCFEFFAAYRRLPQW